MGSSKKVGVILAGCGFLDGAEIHEACCTLLALDNAGVEVVCMAPKAPQMHVVNHAAGAPEEGVNRDVFAESARIARGELVDLASVQASDLDALIIPGGFGVAKNLCTFAVDGPQHCVGIARDPVLLEQVVYVGAELCLAALAESHQNRTALLQVLGHGVEFLRRELLARAGDHKNGSVAQPLQRDRVLVHGELEVGGELAPQHLEPGRQVEDLVVRDVKRDGGKSRHGSWNSQLRVLRVTSPLAGGGKRARSQGRTNLIPGSG